MALVPDGGGVRVAELVATASYAADLGLGQPMEHCMRQTVIALRMADLTGADDRDREATYYLGLLMNAFCHADAAEQTQWFGDDISLKGDGVETLGMSTAQTISFLLRRAASPGSAVQRALHGSAVQHECGLRRWQLDMSWWVIRGLEKLGLVWNVRVPDERQRERRRLAYD